MYGTDKLYKYWLFYGEYYPGVITRKSNPFSYYINASNYNPEQLLFQVHRQYLNTIENGKSIEISPESLMSDPEKWLYKSITAIFHQCKWEISQKNIFISKSSTTIAIKKYFKPEHIEFSKCGIEFIKIQRRSLKLLTEYPAAIDLE
jgi:hypothetical protein